MASAADEEIWIQEEIENQQIQISAGSSCLKLKCDSFKCLHHFNFMSDQLSLEVVYCNDLLFIKTIYKCSTAGDTGERVFGFQMSVCSSEINESHISQCRLETLHSLSIVFMTFYIR